MTAQNLDHDSETTSTGEGGVLNAGFWLNIVLSLPRSKFA